MKSKGILTALVVAAAASPAYAIPVTFDLAGTLRDTVTRDLVNNTFEFDFSRTGTAFSLQLTVDTEQFGPPAIGNVGTAQRRQFGALTPDALVPDFNVGGELWDTSPYANNHAMIGVGDSLGQICNPNCRYAPDQINFSVVSEQVGALGWEQRRMLSFTLAAASSPIDGNYGGGWFDFDDVTTLDQVLLLPLLDLNPITLMLQDYEIECSTQCVNTGTSLTSFDVTSVTRTVASVPEPGTLALMGAGLAFSFALRRRRGNSAD